MTRYFRKVADPQRLLARERAPVTGRRVPKVRSKRDQATQASTAATAGVPFAAVVAGAVVAVLVAAGVVTAIAMSSGGDDAAGQATVTVTESAPPAAYCFPSHIADHGRLSHIYCAAQHDRRCHLDNVGGRSGRAAHLGCRSHRGDRHSHRPCGLRHVLGATSRVQLCHRLRSRRVQLLDAHLCTGHRDRPRSHHGAGHGRSLRHHIDSRRHVHDQRWQPVVTRRVQRGRPDPVGESTREWGVGATTDQWHADHRDSRCRLRPEGRRCGRPGSRSGLCRSDAGLRRRRRVDAELTAGAYGLGLWQRIHAVVRVGERDVRVVEQPIQVGVAECSILDGLHDDRPAQSIEALHHHSFQRSVG